jgi:hypothetical protein
LWWALTALWMMGWISFAILECPPRLTAYTYQILCLDRAEIAPEVGLFWFFGVPVVVLLAGHLTAWVIHGFSVTRPKKKTDDLSI